MLVNKVNLFPAACIIKIQSVLYLLHMWNYTGVSRPEEDAETVVGNVQHGLYTRSIRGSHVELCNIMASYIYDFFF